MTLTLKQSSKALCTFTQAVWPGGCVTPSDTVLRTLFSGRRDAETQNEVPSAPEPALGQPAGVLGPCKSPRSINSSLQLGEPVKALTPAVPADPAAGTAQGIGTRLGQELRPLAALVPAGDTRAGRGRPWSWRWLRCTVAQVPLVGPGLVGLWCERGCVCSQALGTAARAESALRYGAARGARHSGLGSWGRGRGRWGCGGEGAPGWQRRALLAWLVAKSPFQIQI